MSLPHARKLLALLVSSAWLPATITCDPGDLNAVVRVAGVPSDVIVVDGYDYYDGCCGWGDFHFGWWDDHHDDDDD